MKRLLVGAAEVSRLTGWKSKQIYRLVAAGRFPGAVRVGRSVRFKLRVLLRWLEQDTDADRSLKKESGNR